MNSGIYALVNRENGKRYIGRSVNLEKRKNEHFGALKKNRHGNSHLQRAWNTGQRFDFVIIERCEPEECNEREIYWIEKFGSFGDAGYNQCAGGNATLGMVCSEETKRKISKANAGRKCTSEEIARRVATLKKHMESDPEFAAQHREKLSARMRGKPSWNKGRPCPEWKKKQVSEKLKGRIITKEHREKLRERFSGEKSMSVKLKKSDVVAIRYRFLSGERQCEIGKDYPQITPQTIYDIVRGRRWHSVPNDIETLQKMIREGEKNGNKVYANAGCYDTNR